MRAGCQESSHTDMSNAAQQLRQRRALLQQFAAQRDEVLPFVAADAHEQPQQLLVACRERTLRGGCSSHGRKGRPLPRKRCTGQQVVGGRRRRRITSVPANARLMR